MKKLGISPFLTLLSGILFLALTPGAYAVTAPAVSIADDAGNTILVDGNAVVTYGGNCTPATCTTTFVSVSGGQTDWAGTIGSFSLRAVVATTKPYSIPNPSQDLNLQHVTTTTGGTLTIQWTDTDFNYPDIGSATIAAGGVLTGSGSSTYTAYFDNTNAPFGTGIQVGTIGPFTSGAFNGNFTGPGPTASPFSMTEVATVTLGPSSVLGVDYAFVPLPAPLQLMCSANAAQVGVAYTSSLMAIGGIAPYTYSISAGMLPPGLTLNASTGAITGSPTAVGTYSFTAQVQDSSEGSADTVTSTCTIIVTQPPPISLSCPITTGQVNVPYSSALAATGGVPPYTYSIKSGTLPNGLTLNPTTGAITGTPTQAGPFLFVAQVQDSTNTLAGTATSNCGITINSPPSATCVVINAVQNVAITPVTMTATGGTGVGYTFSATGLPAGLTMSSAGTISGTPTVSGTFPYTVTITDSAGTKGTVNCSVTVNPPIAATCVAITAVQNVPITPVTMTATGGTGTGYTFSATGLPTGLTMSSSGTISGTPTVSGTFPYTVTVTDSAGDQGTFNCSVTVNPPISATCVVINAVQNVPIAPVTMTATGGTGTGYTFSATGLPTGLTMSSSGTISGTPTVTGTFPYTVTVTDSAGNKGTFNCSVTVYPPISATCVVINAVQNVPIAPVTMTATGGTGTGYTFSASGLPTGLTMSSNGTISGTPTVTGTFPYTVTVTDSAGNQGTFNCSVTVYPPISATCVVINAVQNVPITPVTMTATGGTGTGYTFSATGLPTGLTMSSNGTISGTPTVTGTFPYTVTVTDSAGNKGTFNCSVTVYPPISATCVVINAIQNVPITPVTMTATGGTGTGYTFSATGLPTGLTMSSGGTISGTPTVSGTFPYTVTVTDSAGNKGTFNCSVTVYPPISATCVVINAIQNVPITPVTMTATGGTGTGYTFSATGLPTGLTMSSGGTISGTPTVSGTFPYTVTVTDSAGNKGTFNCSVTVAPPISATCVVINAVQNVPITPVTMTATGGTGTGYTFSATGLPTGLTMSSNGTISGTPTVTGTFPYTVTVTDSAGNKGSFNCSVTVIPPISTTCVVINAVQNVPITPVTMTATGGTGTGYTFSATGLPTGLTMSSGGTISGTPTVSGTFPYTVTVTDSAGNKGTFNCSVTVAPPISATCVVINAVQNVPITPVTMTATGGTGTGYTFSATGLPTGLTMSSNGTISGTPTVSGTFPYTVTVTDSAGNKGSFNCSVTVIPPISATCVVINAVQNVPITPVTMTATGGTGTGYTFSAVGLPTGLTMSSNGTISGTPTVSGTFPYTVTVTDSAGNKGSFNCSVTVTPAISATCVVINAEQGVTITPVTMTATGGTGTGYTFSAVGLPAGLTMSSNGTISGTPTVSGTFPYTVTVTDSAGNKGSFNCSVTVQPPPSIACSTTGFGEVGVVFNSGSISVTGGSAPYIFSVATGSLPAGLTLNSSTGAITGTPTAAGSFTIKVTDSHGAVATGTCPFTIYSKVTATCPTATTGIVGVTYSSSITGAGGSGAPYTFSNATGMPPGLTISSNGSITGIPTTPGTYNFTVTVTDSAGFSNTASCTIIISPSPLTLLCPAGTAQLNVAYSSTAAVSGGVGPYIFSVATGSLPPGLTLNTSTGAITGTPTTAGTFGFTLKVTDSIGSTALSNCTSSCNASASWNFNVPSGPLGTSQAYTANGITITAYGFTSGGSPVNLFGKNDAGDEAGLGINGLSDSEIDTSHFIQLDLTNVIASGAQNAQIVINSVQSGEGYKIYGSNTLGSLGTFLTSGSLDNTAFNIPGYPTFKYIGVIASSGNVLVGAVSVTTTNCNIVVTAPVDLECGTCGGNKATVGTPYSAQLSATGGTGPYTYSIVSGSLPPGLTLNSSTGVVSGTPTTAGTYTFTSQATDSKGNTDTATCTIMVQPVPIDLECGSCGSNRPTVGQAYSSQLSVTGGIGPYTYSVISGSLPPGLTLNSSTGAITGTPTTPGTYNVTTKVVDSKGNSDTAYCTFVVVPSPINLECGSCGTGKASAGVAYSSQLSVTGGTGPYTFSIISGSLPPGLSLSASTGKITGTPTTAGNYTFTSKVIDANGYTDTQTCTIVVQAPPVNLDCGSCGASNGKVGAPYSATYAITGGKAPFTYSIISGSLPPGLSLNSSTGVISGTPTTAGTYTFTAKVVDANGSTDTQLCTIVVTGSTLNLDCGTCGAGKATVGASYSAQYSVAGGTGPFTYSIISGSLPPGLSLNSYTGVISGKPTTAGSYTFTAKVVDSRGNSDTQACTVVVTTTPIDLECGSCGSGNGTVGSTYSSQLSVTGGTGPFTYSIISGSLPAGLTLNSSTGVISGTPATAGSYTFTSKVVDSKGTSDTTTCTIVVVASTIDLECGSCGAGKATPGTAYSSALSVTGGVAPFTFSIISGSLPAGLTLNSSTGVISGTPATAGSYTFTSKVVDSKGKSDTTTCTIVVQAPPVNLDCGPCSASKAWAGQSYSATMVATGGSGHYTYSVISGSLPAGLTLNSSTGMISGTPTTPGTYTFTSKAVDSNGNSDTDICTIVVQGTPVSLDCGSCGAGNAYQGQGYSSKEHVTGGTGSYTYSIVSGSLPQGLSLNSSTGVISGTPTTTGNYTFTSKAVDSKGSFDTTTCTINVQKWCW